MRIVLATRNPKKRREIAEIYADLPIEWIDLVDRPDVPEVEETGSTFEANARLKAVQVARLTNEWAFGEDSGLVVPALGGEPGVMSARYCGTHGDDAANNRKLIDEILSRNVSDRSAYYVCTAVISDPAGEIVAASEGRCHGVIVINPRGSGGFGYDPLFYIPEYDRTFGELSNRVKHAVSHRARALDRLRPHLVRLCQLSDGR